MPFFAEATKGEGGAAGIRTLVRKWNGQAFYTFSSALIVGKIQAAKPAKKFRSPLSSINQQRRLAKRLFLMMPRMQARLS